ncbi:C2H2 family protein [Salix suchowensis]|nr:C2H2 family protein [Salix suchowensis]
MGSVEIGDISNRSEDEVFTDAVTEFPESGYSSVTGEHTRDVKEQEIDQEFNKATAQTSRDGSIADCRDEESGFEHSHDNEGSACDSIPLKLETQTEASQENKKFGAGKDLSETDAKGHKGAKFDAGEVSEMVSKFQKMEDVTSEPAPNAEFLKLKEGHADVLASGISLNDLSPEVKSDEPVDSSVDAAQTKGDSDSKDNPSGFNLRPLTKDTKVSTSDLHVLDDNLEPKGVVSQLIVEEFPDEAEDVEPLKSEVV